MPEGVLNVVPGLRRDRRPGAGLHMDVDCVAFTGSTEVGKFFLRYAGESNMKRVSLECGGKTPEHRHGRLPGSRRRGDRGGLGHLLQPGRGLQRGLAPDRRGIDQGRSCSRRSAASARSCSRATRWIPRPSMGAHGRQDPDGARARLYRGGQEGRRQARLRRQSRPQRDRRLLHRADDLRRRRQQDDHRAGGDLRAGALDHHLQGRRTRRSRSATTRSMASPPRSGPATSPRPSRRRGHCAPAWSG